MRDIAMALLFCPMLAPSIRYVHLGTMLWAWTALAGPAAYLFGFAADLPFNKAAAAVTFAALLFDRTLRRFRPDAFFIFFTLFLLHGALSYALGPSDLPRGEEAMERMAKIWVLCAVMLLANRERLQIHTMVIVFTLALGLHGILEGLKYLATAGAHRVTPSPVIGDNNFLALSILMVLPFFLYLHQVSAGRPFRLLLAGGFCAALLGVIATASRGGLIGLAVLALMLVLHSRRKLATGLAIAAATLVLAFAAPESWTGRMETLQAPGLDESFQNRVIAWKLNTLLALDHPFLGGGYSAMEDWRVLARYLPQFGALDFIPTETPTQVIAAHSIYFSVLGDQGFIGLFLFLAMLAAAFANLHRIKTMARARPAQEWAGGLALAFQRSLVLFLVVGAALSAAHIEILYIQLTLATVLRRSLEEVPSEPA